MQETAEKRWRNRLLAIVAMLIAGILQHDFSRYLRYADLPDKAEAIVVFVGPGFENRFLEARQLVRERYSMRIVIPAWNQDFICSGPGNGSCRGGSFPDVFRPLMTERTKTLPNYAEATHLEVLEAKSVMDRQGIRSALFVSSPYHMRRIKLIAGLVFDPATYAVRFIPTRPAPPEMDLRSIHLENLRWQGSEFVKLIWFFLYSNVVNFG